jgi:membrane-associated protease RseP (regulator of RpoE activity)
MPDQSTSPLEYQVYDPDSQELRVYVIHPPKRRYWLHALLFVATIFTTMCIGARLQYDFSNNLPAFSDDLDYFPYQWIFQDWSRLWLGIPFSFSLVGILTAHELGHYVLCVRRKVYATLPFFLPVPVLSLIGTMGAFIRIRSPIRSRKDLFDIGIGGPIAGFVVAVPVLFWGLMASKPVPAGMGNSDVAFGLPLIFSLVHSALAALGNAANGQTALHGLYLHPVAIAAWVGMLATALNLLPGGQLDGGHIIFAINPRLHRPVSLLAIAVLVPLSWFYWAGWLLWAVVLRMTGERHPDVPSQPGLDGKRLWLAAFALFMLIVTLAPIPIGGNKPDDASSLKQVLKNYHEDSPVPEKAPPSKK